MGYWSFELEGGGVVMGLARRLPTDRKRLTIALMVSVAVTAGAALVLPSVSPAVAATGTPRPHLHNIKLHPHRFHPVSKGGTFGGNRKTGTRITYRDTANAHTTFVVALCTVFKSGHCVHKRRLGKFVHQDIAGPNQLRFSGRLRHRALKPGHYLLRVTARLGGKHSRTTNVGFTILS